MTLTACAEHTAVIFERGGRKVFGELTPLAAVRWQRIRDDISTAEVTVPTTECCELLGELRSIRHELHIYRDGVEVWQGPITRIEYEWEQVQVFAQDVLWVASRTVLDEGYSHAYPNIGSSMDRMDWLLRNKCYSIDGDPWHVLPHLHPIRHGGEPKTSRAVNAWQYYIWEDFDKYAEDYGTDYTVVNRNIFYFDIHLAWKVIAPLTEDMIGEFPRIVEYGNQLGTRGVVTNGQGYAGTASAPSPWPDLYGRIDWLVTNDRDGESTDEEDVPTAQDLEQWSQTAANNIAERAPAPLSIVIPANTTLLPTAPWSIEDLVPGAWFQASVVRMCRKVTEFQRLHEVVVTEDPQVGERIQFSAVAAPEHRINWET